MKRKRYLAVGLVIVVAVAIGLLGWGYAGPATAHPGNTCNPPAGHGNPGCHVSDTTTTAKATTTTAKATTTTAKATTTTAKPNTTTTKGSTTTTKGSTTTTAAGTTTTAANTTTTSPTNTSVTLAPAGNGFSDVPASHPYFKQIGDVVARQVMSGNADGTFKPDLPVTRQDFAKMIVKALNLAVTGKETSPFTDVVGGKDADPLFPDKYVAVCFAQGITVGKTATTFAPSDNLTRQQLISMVVRAAKSSDAPADFTPPFTVGQFFPDEHYANARKAASSGLLASLQAVDSAYDFLAPATRGEVAVVLDNLLNKK
jgi:S-layer homology domain